MTISAYAEELDTRLPSEQERAAANQLRQILAARAVPGEAQVFQFTDAQRQPAEIILTPALSHLLMELLRHVGRGDAVTLVPVGKMLTTQQAADILNVSRPHLISLLERGQIPYGAVGRHRRIKAEHLFDYKRARDATREAALAELAALDGEHL